MFSLKGASKKVVRNGQHHNAQSGTGPAQELMMPGMFEG
jgi:hypothetical protein